AAERTVVVVAPQLANFDVERFLVAAVRLFASPARRRLVAARLAGEAVAKGLLFRLGPRRRFLNRFRRRHVQLFVPQAPGGGGGARSSSVPPPAGRRVEAEALARPQAARPWAAPSRS